MKGTITKYRKKDGRVSWGYYYKIGEEQFTKSGYGTKDDACNALDAAIKAQTQETPIATATVVSATPVTTEPSAIEPLWDQRTLAEYLPYWLDDHAALRCAPTTMELYRKLSAYLTPHLGKVRICDLKAAQIQETVNRLYLRGGRKTPEHPDGRPLSAKRTHAIASLLFTCLTDAVRLEHIPANPMADRRVKFPSQSERKTEALDPSMLGKLFNTARGLRVYPFIVLAASSGCRRGELCALTWDDIDFEKCSMSISKSLEQTKVGGLRIKSTKSGKPRFFGLDEFALDVLTDHLEQQAEDKRNFGCDYRTDLNLVFCQPNGYYYSPDKIGSRVKEVLVKAGFEGFSLHDLRHSHASVLLGQGVPLAVVSERLGHADQNITLTVYNHALPKDMKAASKAWHNALAEVISEDRSTWSSKKNLGKSRKFAVND